VKIAAVANSLNQGDPEREWSNHAYPSTQANQRKETTSQSLSKPRRQFTVALPEAPISSCRFKLGQYHPLLDLDE
jgi:hypothetical protein